MVSVWFQIFIKHNDNTCFIVEFCDSDCYKDLQHEIFAHTAILLVLNVNVTLQKSGYFEIRLK